MPRELLSSAILAFIPPLLDCYDALDIVRPKHYRIVLILHAASGAQSEASVRVRLVPGGKHKREPSMASIFYGWWIVGACFVIAFYVGGPLYYGLTAFFEPIVEEFGWSHTQVSIAFSLRGLEMGILAPLVGFLVDRFGSRKVILPGALIVGFAVILLAFTNSLIMFYGAFFLLASGTSGCETTALMTAIAQWFRRDAGKAMGIVACGFGAGGILIPLIVWLIDVYQWRTVLIVLGVGIWALGIPLSLVIRHRPEQYGYLPDGEIRAEPSSSHGGREMGEEDTFAKALKNRDFWKIGASDAIRVMITMAVITHVMPYLSSIGISRGRAALVATFIPLVSNIGRLGFGWLGDVIEKRYVLAGLYCLLGIGTLAFSYIHLKYVIFPFILFFSMAFGGAISLRGAIVREYFGRASFGRLIGIMLGMTAIGGVIGPTVAGWTFDTCGGYQPVWRVFAGITVIAIVLLLRLKVPHQMSEELRK